MKEYGSISDFLIIWLQLREAEMNIERLLQNELHVNNHWPKADEMLTAIGKITEAMDIIKKLDEEIDG